MSELSQGTAAAGALGGVGHSPPCLQSGNVLKQLSHCFGPVSGEHSRRCEPLLGFGRMRQDDHEFERSFRLALGGGALSIKRIWAAYKQPATPSPGETAPSSAFYGDLYPHGVILMDRNINTCESNLKATKSKNKKPNPGLRYLPFMAVGLF